MNRIARSLLGLLLVLGLTLGPIAGATALAAPAEVGPSPSESSAPALTWAVRPASPEGPDERRWVEATLGAGETHEDRLAVSNFSAEPVTFTLVAADGYFTKAGSFTLKRPDEENTDAGTWITFAEPTVTVAAGATAIVPFTVAVPANATPGDHAAGVAAGMVITGTEQSGSSVGVNSRVGFRVMVRVTGEVTAAVEVRDLDASYDLSWNPFRPGHVRVNADVANTGNVLVHTTGTATAGGKTRVAGGRDLLPGEQATLAATVPAWPFGPIEVSVAAVGDPGADGVAAARHTDTMTVWALPLPQLIVLAALACLVIGIVVLRRRNRSHWEARLAEARAEGAAEAARGAED